MATFNFNCPQCKNLLSAEDEWRGMESECPYCQETITIPLEENLPKEDSKKTLSFSKNKLIKISIISVLICSIITCIAIWLVSITPKKVGSPASTNSESRSVEEKKVDVPKPKTTESFTYYFRLPVTDNVVCMELWSNLPGSIQKWVIVTQAGKRWELHCKEQIPQNIDGKTMYVAQYFFPKAWYLDNLIFDPIVSVELSVANSDGSNDISFVLNDTDKALFTQVNTTLISSSTNYIEVEVKFH